MLVLFFEYSVDTYIVGVASHSSVLEVDRGRYLKKKLALGV